MRRSPQDKKALSYARDCRYAYGNNEKAARKSVPRRKRLVNKANRHADQQQLLEARGSVDAEKAELAEERLLARRPKSWQKWPDWPLGQMLGLKQARAEGRSFRRSWPR